MKHNKTAGFSAIEAVVTFLVVAILGFVGWYVWNNNHKTSQKPATASSQTQTANQSGHGNTSEQQADPSEGGKYLVIKEWGVRVPLPTDLQGDVEYGMRKRVILSRPQDSEVYGEIIYFASKKLTAMPATPNYCGLRSGAQDDLTGETDPNSYEGGPGVFFERSTTRLLPNYDSDLLISGYWYRGGKGSAGTCYQGSNGSQEGHFIYSMLDAVKSAQAIPEN